MPVVAGRLRSLVEARIAVLQVSIAAGGAWALATSLLGQHRPIFAPVAAILTLGGANGQFPRRAAEIATGVVLGIVAAELLRRSFGIGPLQLLAAVALATSAAVLLGASPTLINQAAISSVLLLALPAQGTALSRIEDAVLGGGLAIVVSQMAPRRQRLETVRRSVRPLLEGLALVLDDTRTALASGDVALAGSALDHARQLDPIARDAYESIRLAQDMSRLSRHDDVSGYDELVRHIDYAVRNARVLARGSLGALRDGADVAGLGDALRELVEAARALRRELDEDTSHDSSTAPAVRAAELATQVARAGVDVRSGMLVSQIRGIAVDLMCAGGTPREQAIQALPTAT